MLHEPIVWGSVALLLSVVLIMTLKATFWPKQDFRPTAVRQAHDTLPIGLRDITQHRAKRIRAMPIGDVMRMEPEEIEHAITHHGRRITLLTRRTTLPDGRIRVWIETSDDRWYSSEMPASDVIILEPGPQPPPSAKPGHPPDRAEPQLG